MEIDVEQSKTPKEWVEYFSDRGLQISERNLRATARKNGLCLLFGREMLISPDQMDALWKLNSFNQNEAKPRRET